MKKAKNKFKYILEINISKNSLERVFFDKGHFERDASDRIVENGLDEKDWSLRREKEYFDAKHG